MTLLKGAYEELQPMINRTIRDKGSYKWYSIDSKPNGSASFKGSAGVLANVMDQLKERQQ